uniref:Uncharacterized protein n=1 Tax=Poecilia latipinna TaxID=48699 RepID=A0A3B3VET8_9TELE
MFKLRVSRFKLRVSRFKLRVSRFYSGGEACRSAACPASPLLLGQNEFGQVGVKLVLLVDAFVLDAVPALLLGDAKRARDVVSEIQPLLFCQVADGLVVVLQLQVTLAQEEVSLDRLTVQLQCVLAVCQSFVVLLQLHVAERPVGVVHRHRRITVLQVEGNRNSAGQEQPVPLLLQLLRGGALLGAAGHLLHRLRGARLALLPNPVPRLSGWLGGRCRNVLPALDRTQTGGQ